MIVVVEKLEGQRIIRDYLEKPFHLAPFDVAVSQDSAHEVHRFLQFLKPCVLFLEALLIYRVAFQDVVFQDLLAQILNSVPRCELTR